MLWVIIGIIVAIGLISWAVTGDATDVKGAANAVKDGASSAAGTVGGAVTGATSTVGGAVTGAAGTVGGATSTVASAPAPPPPPPITYSKYSDNPFWDGGAKLTCPTAVGVNLTGGNKGYADYCIFTGTGAEANAQTACSSISNCVGYVVGTDSTGPMYQLTTMPKYDPGTPSHRFYAKKPLPEGVTLPSPIVYSKYNEKPYWDGGAKLTCPTAVGVNLTGNNKDYANYCIFTGTGAEANAQTACSSISNCVGYVVGKDNTGPMYQLTTMPRYDPSTPYHRFYAKKPLPEGVSLSTVAGFSNRPSLSSNPGYHSDIQAFGGDPTMNLV